MFAVIFICILREGIWKNRKKIRTRKNFVPHGIQVLFIRMFCLLPFFNVQFVAAFHGNVASQYIHLILITDCSCHCDVTLSLGKDSPCFVHFL